MVKLVNTILTVVAGVGAALVLYWILNKVAELLPGRWEDRLKPYLYILPAVGMICLYVLYPGIQTIVYSFANAESTKFVGLENYTKLLSSSGLPADDPHHAGVDHRGAAGSGRAGPAGGDAGRPAQPAR